MTGRPIGLRIATATIAALLFGSVVAEAAVTDPVPLPRFRPVRAGEPAAAQLQPQPVAEEKGGGLKLPKFLRKKDPARPSPFPPEQQQLLANVDAYFNSFRTMEGEFTQTGPNGEPSEGVFFISRPGKIRFHYRPPVRLDIVSDGSSVAIRDGKAKTQDLYPLSKTPLRYLLANEIDLTSGDLVRQVREDADTVALVIVEKSTLVEGKLTLIFDRKTFELKEWIVTDAQGLNTTVNVFNVSTGKPQDQALFRITINNDPKTR